MNVYAADVTAILEQQTPAPAWPTVAALNTPGAARWNQYGNTTLPRYTPATAGIQAAGGLPPFGGSTVDTFTGTDETPIASGWTSDFYPAAAPSSGLRRLSGELAGAGPGLFANSWRDDNIYGPDLYTGATITALPAGAGDSIVHFAVRLTNIGSGSTNGYLVAIQRQATPGDKIIFVRIDVSAQTSIGTGVTTADAAVGTKYGLKVLGDTITVMADYGDGWQEQATVTDATYATAGRAGIEMYSDVSRLDDWFAITVTDDEVIPGEKQPVPVAPYKVEFVDADYVTYGNVIDLSLQARRQAASQEPFVAPLAAATARQTNLYVLEQLEAVATSKATLAEAVQHVAPLGGTVIVVTSQITGAADLYTAAEASGGRLQIVYDPDATATLAVAKIGVTLDVQGVHQLAATDAALYGQDIATYATIIGPVTSIGAIATIT